MLGYANIMKFLTISEEHKLRLEVKKLTKEQDEIAIMNLRHEKEIAEMRQEIKIMMSMIRHNPGLVQIKPEVLLKKKFSYDG